jgi:ABC-type Na+ efflux pump permease subunit
MSTVIAIAVNELRRVSRDRTALFFFLALPVTIIVIIGSTFTDEDALGVGVLDHDGSERSDALVAALDATDGLAVDRYDSLDTLRRDIRTGTVSAGVVLPAGLGTDIDAGGTVTVDLVADPTSGAGPAVQATIRAAVADEAGRTAAARFASEHGARSYDEAVATADRIAADLPVASVRSEAVNAEEGRDWASSASITPPRPTWCCSCSSTPWWLAPSSPPTGNRGSPAGSWLRRTAPARSWSASGRPSCCSRLCSRR